MVQQPPGTDMILGELKLGPATQVISFLIMLSYVTQIISVYRQASGFPYLGEYNSYVGWTF